MLAYFQKDLRKKKKILTNKKSEKILRDKKDSKEILINDYK